MTAARERWSVSVRGLRRESDREFIDDSEYDESVTDYYGFTNVTKSYEEVMREGFEDDNIDERAEIDNYREEANNAAVDDFKNSTDRVEKFKLPLQIPQGKDNPDLFFYLILHALRYKHNNKTGTCADESELRSDVSVEIFDEINNLKDKLKLNLEILNFENQCFQINRILVEKHLLLRVYEIKDKFCYLIKEDYEKKKVIRDLSSCITERFNGFNIVKLELDRQLRCEISPIDILYKPVKKQTNIDRFFSTQINLVYRSSFNEGEKIRHGTAFQCFYCSNFYGKKNSWEKHLQHCTSRPGFVYNFNNGSLLNFEENLKYKTEIPQTPYIDSETTAPTDDCLDPENRRVFALSCVIIFAFHTELSLDRIIIERSFGHSLSQLCSLDYLSNEQLKYKDLTTLKQLRNCALLVSSKSKKITISEMFTTELKFAGNCLIKWFNAKSKSQNLVLSNNIKIKYQNENPIDWQSERCCVCTFPTEINPTTPDATKDSDSIIPKEHKFLRNIFTEKELSDTVALKDFPTYHKKFSLFLRIAIYLQNRLEHVQNFSDCVYDELIDFVRNIARIAKIFQKPRRGYQRSKLKTNHSRKFQKAPYKFTLSFIKGSWTFPTVNLTTKF